jgi:flagellar biosynthesis protein FlhG
MGDQEVTVSRVVAVVGSPRGIGRSRIALDLAVAVAARGRRVCLLDADGGATSRILSPGGDVTLLDVIAGRARLSDALTSVREGIDLLTLTVRDRRTAPVTYESALLAHVDALEARYDLVMIDTPGGTQAGGLFLAGAATDVLLVVTPQAAVIRQAETLLRILAARCGRHEVFALPNACASAEEATTIVRALAARSPHVRVRPLGWIPYDGAVRRARRSLLLDAPETPAAQALASAAARLVSLAPARPTGGAQFFFQSLIAQGRAA